MQRHRIRAAVLSVLLLSATNGCAAVIQAPTPVGIAKAREREKAGCYGPGKPVGAAASVCGTASSGEAEALAAPGEQMEDLHFVHQDYRNAAAFCKNIKQFGQERYKRYAGYGGVVGILGLAGTSAGATWIATDDEKDQMIYKVAVTATSAVVAALGAWMIERSVAAATASGEAGVSLGPAFDGQENARYQACLETQAKWLGANAASLRAISKAADAAKADKSGGSGAVVVPNQEEFFAWVQANCTENLSKVEPVGVGKVKRLYRCTTTPAAAAPPASPTKQRQYFEKYYRSEAAFIVSPGTDVPIVVDLP